MFSLTMLGKGAQQRFQWSQRVTVAAVFSSLCANEVCPLFTSVCTCCSDHSYLVTNIKKFKQRKILRVNIPRNKKKNFL